MDQDTTARRQRQMIDGKRGPKLTSDFAEVENITSMTYDPVTANVTQMIKERVDSDGTIWTKTIDYTYDANGNLQTQTESVVISP